MPKRVALYLRVSTRGQSVNNQKLDLEAVAKRSGWEIVAEYQETQALVEQRGATSVPVLTGC